MGTRNETVLGWQFHELHPLLPTQAFNLAFKDTFKKMFPKYNPKTEFLQFFGANLVSGGLAAAGSLTIVYPLDYARTRLASDVGSGKNSRWTRRLSCPVHWVWRFRGGHCWLPWAAAGN